MTDTITRLGLKAAIDDEGNVSGWLAPFGGPFNGKDLDGEFFDPKTDFALDYYTEIPVLFAHGHDPEVGAAKVGTISVKEIRDKGLWVQGHLDKQSAYYDAIRQLAQGNEKDSVPAADLYWSSGAIAHLVQTDRKTGRIKQWPIAEATLTLTPANPLAEASVKEVTTQAEPETVTATDQPLVEVTVNTKKMDAQSLHDLSLAMGAQCPDMAKGEAKDAPPADVLAPAGNDVEPATGPDLDALKSLLVSAALSEVRRRIG